MSCQKKVHENTQAAFPSSLALFNIPPTNVAFTSCTFKRVLPSNPVTQDPYYFQIYNDNNWLDLSRTYVETEFEVRKYNETTKTYELLNSKIDDVAMINLIGLTMFSRLRVDFNGTNVYDSNQLYPYLTYLTAELTHPANVKATELRAAGFASSLKHGDTKDPGFKIRNSLINKGYAKTFARLDFDFANQPLLLLNDINVLFTLYKSNREFCIEAPEGGSYLFRIHSINLYVCCIELQPALNVKFFQKLEETPATYALRKTEMKSIMITSSRTEFQHNLFTGVIPRRIIFGLVALKNFNGNIQTSPFDFKHYNLTDYEITAAGKKYPLERYNMDFTKNYIARPYVDTIHALGQHFNPNNNNITMDQFNNGWTIFVVDLSPSQEELSGFELIQNGSTDIKLEFSSPVPGDGLELIVLGEFDQILSIDNHRRVKFE